MVKEPTHGTTLAAGPLEGPAASGATPSKLIEATANKKRHHVLDLCRMTGLGNVSINNYAKIAGVPTARPGERNFRWTDADAKKILTAILDGSSDHQTRERCNAALESLDSTHKQLR